MSDAKVHYRQYQAYMLSVANCMIQLIQMYDLDMEEIFEEGRENDGSIVTVVPGIQKREEFCSVAHECGPAYEPGHEPGAGQHHEAGHQRGQSSISWTITRIRSCLWKRSAAISI